MSASDSLRPEGLPRHVAFIMDGNGRWATRQGLPRSVGHWRGAEAARRVVSACRRLGIPYVTLFGFSSENWRRPEAEIEALMTVLRHYLRRPFEELDEKDARLKVIGDLSRLPRDLVPLIEEAERRSAHKTGITVQVALSYGGRQDIVEAARRMAAAAAEGRLAPEEIDEQLLSRNLATDGVPDPDLLVRTGAEMRISNFLLWQLAYAELYFSDRLWPDYGEEDLRAAIAEFQRRERRFGNVPIPA